MINMRKYIAIFLMLILGTAALSAQNRKAVRINEVMVENNNSIVDDYGERHPWIELFNSNFAPVEISSLFLTNDPNNKRLYPVPLGDVNTRIARRQHVVFFADGQPNRGTFHTNFILVPGQENWIGLYDADGSLIDEVTVTPELLADQTYARSVDGNGVWEVRTGGGHDYITPSGANVIEDTNERIELFAERDKNGFAMTLMAMGVVFSALLVLCLCFYALGKIGAAVSLMNKRVALKGEAAAAAVDDDVDHDSGEEIAAIVMALHQHLNAHDNESTVLTINKVKRAYSPWSSKIYGLRSMPDHNRH